MPTSADIEQLSLHLTKGTEVFLSDVPRRLGSVLVESCARLSAAGLVPVPHVAVRRIGSTKTLEKLLVECVERGGARKALLIAGDQAVPDGPFFDVAAVLRHSGLRRCGIETVAVAAYPDGHPSVSVEMLDQALMTKLTLLEEQGLKRQIVTQFGFDARQIRDWLAHLRQRDIREPVSVGVAGPATAATLMKFALRCGVRTVGRGLVRDAGRWGSLLSNQSDRLIGPLAAIASEPELAPVKAHVFTFGGLAKTVRWVSALQSGRFAVVDGAIRLDASID